MSDLIPIKLAEQAMAVRDEEIAKLKAEVERLRSQFANSEWQPIETAPYHRPQRYAPSRKCIGKMGKDSPIYIIDPPLPDDNGEYVKYEDFERLKKDNIDLINLHIQSLSDCLRLAEENKKLKGL